MPLTQPDSPPAAAEAALRVLRGVGKVSREDLASLIRGGQDDKVVGMALRDLTAIGVLLEEGGVVTLSDTARRASTNRIAIRKCLFSHVDPGSLWDSDEKGSLRLEAGRDLVRALAWFLSLPVRDGPYKYAGDIDSRQTRDLGMEVVAASERWLPFARWGAYLGLTRFDPGGGVSPDPSIALADVLRDAKDPTLGPDELVAVISAELPVLEQGVYAAAIASRRQAAPEPSAAEADVSSAVAYALLCLHGAGLIELELSTGDSRKGRMPDSLGAFSRVVWTGGR
jgi:hypothetical protein